MDAVTRMGYKDNSPYRNNPQNFIKSHIITMQGVSKPLTLVPVINGVPHYDKKVIAHPGDPDVEFDPSIDGVLELPYGQTGLYTSNGLSNNLGIGFIPNPFLNTQPMTPIAQAPTFNQGISPQRQALLGTTPQTIQQQAIENVAPATINDTQVKDLAIEGKYGHPTPGDPAYTLMMQEKMGVSTPDRNEVQQAQASTTNTTQNNAYVGPINPYGGWNMMNSSSALGAFIQMKPQNARQSAGKTLGIVGSAGKILLEGLRNGFSGAAAMKVYQESLNEQADKDWKAERQAKMRWVPSAQKGGNISKMMTGHYIEGNDNHSSPTAEVEAKEYLQTPDGSTMQVIGDRHAQGGELLDLPENTKVISDYLKIGSKLASYFKKEYGLNVTAGSKFATVMTQYRKKIGLTELLEEEEALYKKMTKQQDVQMDTTRDMNLEMLNRKLDELQPKKQDLEQKFSVFTNLVFDKQEQTKKPGGYNYKKQTGGEIMNPETEQGAAQPQDAGSQLEQIVLMFAQVTGQDPRQIIGQLQQLQSEEELQQAVTQMMQVIQQVSQQQEQQQPAPENTEAYSMDQYAQPAPQGTTEDPQAQMQRGGMYLRPRYQNGGFADDNTQAGNFTDRTFTKDGVDYYIYGQGSDTRMVPKNLVDSNPNSVYRSDAYMAPQYQSDYQQNLRTETQNRYNASPVDYKSVSKDEAKRIQQVLKDAGYKIGKVDGIIGKNTLAALRSFQVDDNGAYRSWINLDLRNGRESRSVKKLGGLLAQIQKEAGISHLEEGGRVQYMQKGGTLENVKTLMELMKVPLDTIDPKDPHKRTLLETIAEMNSTKGLNAQKLYSVLKYYSKVQNLPEDYASFKKSRFKDVAFGGQDLFAQMDRDYKEAPAKEAPAPVKPTPVAATPSTSTPATPAQRYDPRYRANPLVYTPSTVYDDGFSETTGKLDNTSYIAYRTPQGRSQLGAADVYGEVYNPGGTSGSYLGLDKTASLARYDKNYKTDYDQLVADLANAKTDQERFDIWNTRGQKRRQQSFTESFSPEIQAYVGMGYAPTESQLKATYDSLSGEDKKNFESILNKSGIKIANGKVIPGGFYKNAANYTQDSDLYKFYEGMKTTNPEMYTNLGIKNITDGVWDRRVEALHDLEFASIKDRDDYAKKNNFTQFTNKDGDTVWVDPNNRNNIIIPRVYRDKEVTQEEFDRWNKMSNADKEGYKDVGTKGVFERWYVKADPKAGIDPMGNKKTNYTNPFPLAVPDQENLPPNLLQPGLRQVTHVQANPIAVSPEETLKELNRQYGTAATAMVQANPYTSGAAMANLQSQANDSINKAYSQADMANQADLRNVENINESRINQRENTNLGLLQAYEDKAQAAADNYYQSWRGFINNRNQQMVNNWNLQNEVNMFNSVNPNQQIGPLGQVYQTPEEVRLFVNAQGQQMAYNPKTGEKYVMTKTGNKDGTTSTTTAASTKQTGKKGGLLRLSKPIPKYFK